MTRPRTIGTAAETAVVRFLRGHGHPHAERRALHGAQDRGDVTGTPGIAWEVKGGAAADRCQPAKLRAWLHETATERDNAGADIGVLVTRVAGVGAARCGLWSAWLTVRDLRWLHGQRTPVATDLIPVRLLLVDACRLLAAAGYGDPVEMWKEAA